MTSATMTDELFSVREKVVVVTGGGRGLGEMIARGFTERHAKVYIVGRDVDTLTKTAERLSAAGTCIPVAADLSTVAGMDAVAEALSAEPAVHVLVNNAGANIRGEVGTYPESAFDDLFAINVKPVFGLVQRLLPGLRKAASPGDPARVVNIGSVVGLKPSGQGYAYSTTKAAVHALTRHLALALGPESITVNAIAPGPFETELMAGRMDRIVSQLSIRRPGVDLDLIGAVVFLASRAGAFVHGSVLPVDGGLAIT
ncbi:SDR family NAD(P)-dependent oxidoreductase [Amycolatopsis sp. NPDC051372]|uniref:SDR family NAD(P)-dependent oxidoreductase n=1 Tax=Amycolatopsis sp. NPDC051372 TaxID=3155669 RepID=UPI00342CDE93